MVPEPGLTLPQSTNRDDSPLIGPSPIGNAEFGQLITNLRLSEPPDHIVVAVSGGGDSIALCLLAAQWAAENGAKVTALTVDHGLRAGSSQEAGQVAAWLSQRSIEHEVICWTEAKPVTGVQEAARKARYALIADWMIKRKLTNLLVAHHAEDQAETFLLRAGQGSGIDGLAAMAPVSRRNGLRLLRPLLAIPKSRLTATLKVMQQPWIEDPSNQDHRYSRVQFRSLLPGLADAGMPPGRIAALAEGFGVLSRSLHHIDRLAIAACTTLHPEGYATLDRAYVGTLPIPLQGRVLRQLIHAVGGRTYPPRRAAVDRLLQRLTAGTEFRGATLGGCRIQPWRGRTLICREARNFGTPLVLHSTQTVTWHALFEVVVSGAAGLIVGPLTKQGWKAISGDVSADASARIPAIVLPSLPVFYDSDGVLAVPALDYHRDSGAGMLTMARNLRFSGFDNLLITTDCLDLAVI